MLRRTSVPSAAPGLQNERLSPLGSASRCPVAFRISNLACTLLPQWRSRAQGWPENALSGLGGLGATLLVTTTLPSLLLGSPRDAGWLPVGLSTHSAPEAREARLASGVLQALHADPGLCALNIGVTVADHVVTLWGPAPSAWLAHRAVEVARGVDGVANVENDLRIPVDLPNGAEEAFDQESPDAGPDSAPVDDAAPKWMPAGAACPSGPAHPRTFAPASRPVESALSHDSPPPLRDTVLKPTVQLLPPVPLNSEAALAQAVERVRRIDPRFAGILARLEAGVVHLRCVPSSDQAVFALAKAVAEVPGVVRVVIDKSEMAVPPSGRP